MPQAWREPSRLLQSALTIHASDFIDAPVPLAQDYAYFAHLRLLLSEGRPTAAREIDEALEKAAQFAQALLQLTTNVGLSDVMRLLVANTDV